MTAAADTLELSVVIPAYNEAGRIRRTLEEYARHFAALYADAFEVIVVLNGCTDDTRSVVESVTQEAPQVRLVEFPERLGKGGAIREGFAVARGRRIVFVDADNMVRAPEAEKLVRALDQHDAAIASRFGPGQEGERNQPLPRRLLSRGLRVWVRRFLGLPFRDTLCGAKAFRSEAWRAVAPHVRERGWAFDIDVLAAAKRLGLSVAEVPVEWLHVAEGSKLQPWKAIPEMLLATLRIRLRTLPGGRPRP